MPSLLDGRNSLLGGQGSLLACVCRLFLLYRMPSFFRTLVECASVFSECKHSSTCALTKPIHYTTQQRPQHATLTHAQQHTQNATGGELYQSDGRERSERVSGSSVVCVVFFVLFVLACMRVCVCVRCVVCAWAWRVCVCVCVWLSLLSHASIDRSRSWSRAA